MNIIVDYGMGNLSSISNMIKRIGLSVKITSDLNLIQMAEKLILPGVGAFDLAMRNLLQSGLAQVIKEKALSKKTKILGICLGMQLLLESSEEGCLPGLGLVPGRVRKFQFVQDRLKVPHMGWNMVTASRPSLLFEAGLEGRFYFVHSFYVECGDAKDVAGITCYGHDFTSVLERDNIIGVQFHPEKSHRFGMTLFEKFIKA